MSLRLTAQRWQCFFENAICCQNDNYLKISCVVACFYNNFISYVYKFHTGTLLSLFYMCYGWLAGWLVAGCAAYYVPSQIKAMLKRTDTVFM